MIKYKLICKNCNLSFDSWFTSSEEYEKLKKKKFLDCHKCNSRNVEKTLMAPKLINKKEVLISEKDIKKFKDVKKTLNAYKKFIKKNFEYVGENFAYEARSSHYDNKKKNKGIYGIATKKELKELKEEGINTQVMPWPEDKIN